MKLIQILEILQKYHIDEDYPIWAEHDIIGFYMDSEEISEEDMKILKNLGVFYNAEYEGLTIYV